MWKYVLKRIGLAFLTTVIILTLTFILMKLLPFSKPIGNDQTKLAYYLTQVNEGLVMVTKRPIKGVEELFFSKDTRQYFYQVPVMQQYFNWVFNIVTKWNWGTSTYITPNVGAITLIAERLPVSMKINIFSVILSVPLGILLGIIAALKKNKATDHFISTGVMIFISIPSFVLITLFMLLFGYTTHWLPTQWPAATAPMGDRFLGYIIPVLCLSFGSICGYARFTRAELCEVMSSEYLLLARTKGLTKRQAITRHALRNAMVPIVPSILAEFIGVLSGSMILENLYGIPGIGDLFVQALGKKDFNVLLVDMAIFTTVGLLAGVILDISYGFIDPRIRMGAKK